MTDILFGYDYILMRSEYKTPETHSHLAAHLMTGLDGEIECETDGERFTAGGICIAPDVPHTVRAERGELLFYLFDTAGDYAASLEEKYLKTRRYCILDDTLVREIRGIWERERADLHSADKAILEACGLSAGKSGVRDERIKEALEYLKQLDTIPDDIMEQLCAKACLSRSRFSHLFREQAGISLHRYLALDKMKKGYIHFRSTGSITEAAMRAGFDSPSHFAATCKRMFGISFSEFADSTKNSI